MRNVKYNQGANGGGTGTGGSTSTEGEGGKAKETPPVATMTEEEFLAANPKFRERFEAGNKAITEAENQKRQKQKEEGDHQALLTDAEKRAEKAAADAATASERANAAERKNSIREYIDTLDTKELKATPAAIYELATLLDKQGGGKGDVKAVIKQAIEKLGAWGAGKVETTALDASGTGSPGTTGGSEEEKRETELIELGAAAQKSGSSNDQSAYERAKQKYRNDFKKIPTDLAKKISDKVKALGAKK